MGRSWGDLNRSYGFKAKKPLAKRTPKDGDRQISIGWIKLIGPFGLAEMTKQSQPLDLNREGQMDWAVRTGRDGEVIPALDVNRRATKTTASTVLKVVPLDVVGTTATR